MEQMTEAERRLALERIGREGEVLRNLAKRAGADFIAFMLANVVEEVRSKLASEADAMKGRR